MTGEAAKNETNVEAKGKYCILTGETLLYAMDLEQLEALAALLDHPHPLNAPTADNREEEETEIELQKNTIVYSDNYPSSVSYSLYSKESEIQMVSYDHLKKMSDLLQEFLKNYDKNHEMSYEEAEKMMPASDKEELSIRIWKEEESPKREVLLKDPANLTQRIIRLSSKPDVQVQYMFAINERCSDWLSPQQLKDFSKTLKKFIEEEKKKEGNQLQ